jgi:hypothetical protein
MNKVTNQSLAVACLIKLLIVPFPVTGLSVDFPFYFIRP